MLKKIQARKGAILENLRREEDANKRRRLESEYVILHRAYINLKILK